MNNIRRKEKKEKDDGDTDDYSGDSTRPGHLKSDSLRGGSFSDRAASAYRNDDTGNGLRRERIRGAAEGHMCPACIARTAVMVARAGSTGGILAVCIGKFRKFSRANRLGLLQKTKEKIRWQQGKRETRTRKGISR
jgi:hypothetical protein